MKKLGLLALLFVEHVLCECPPSVPDGGKQAVNQMMPDQPLYDLIIYHHQTDAPLLPVTQYSVGLRAMSPERPFRQFRLHAEAHDEDCGYGLFRKKAHDKYDKLEGCPHIMTNLQDAQPATKNSFRWKTPKCGCVTLRAVVLSEDGSAQYGSDHHLTKHVCTEGSKLDVKKKPIDEEVKVKDEPEIEKPAHIDVPYLVKGEPMFVPTEAEEHPVNGEVYVEKHEMPETDSLTGDEDYYGAPYDDSKPHSAEIYDEYKGLEDKEDQEWKDLFGEVEKENVNDKSTSEEDDYDEDFLGDVNEENFSDKSTSEQDDYDVDMDSESQTVEDNSDSDSESSEQGTVSSSSSSNDDNNDDESSSSSSEEDGVQGRVQWQRNRHHHNRPGPRRWGPPHGRKPHGRTHQHGRPHHRPHHGRPQHKPWHHGRPHGKPSHHGRRPHPPMPHWPKRHHQRHWDRSIAEKVKWMCARLNESDNADMPRGGPQGWKWHMNHAGPMWGHGQEGLNYKHNTTRQCCRKKTEAERIACFIEKKHKRIDEICADPARWEHTKCPFLPKAIAACCNMTGEKRYKCFNETKMLFKEKGTGRQGMKDSAWHKNVDDDIEFVVKHKWHKEHNDQQKPWKVPDSPWKKFVPENAGWMCEMVERGESMWSRFSGMLGRFSGSLKDKLQENMEKYTEDMKTCCQYETNDDRVKCLFELKYKRYNAICADQEKHLEGKCPFLPLAIEQCCPLEGQPRYDCFNKTAHEFKEDHASEWVGRMKGEANKWTKKISGVVSGFKGKFQQMKKKFTNVKKEMTGRMNKMRSRAPEPVDSWFKNAERHVEDAMADHAKDWAERVKGPVAGIRGFLSGHGLMKPDLPDPEPVDIEPEPVVISLEESEVGVPRFIEEPVEIFEVGTPLFIDAQKLKASWSKSDEVEQVTDDDMENLQEMDDEVAEQIDDDEGEEEEEEAMDGSDSGEESKRRPGRRRRPHHRGRKGKGKPDKRKKRMWILKKSCCKFGKLKGRQSHGDQKTCIAGAKRFSMKLHTPFAKRICFEAFKGCCVGSGPKPTRTTRPPTTTTAV